MLYLDSGVLIQAWRGGEVPTNRARNILLQPDVRFVGSRLQRMETVLRTRGAQASAERAFYNGHFALALVWATLDENVAIVAEDFIARYGLSIPDALHVALALRGGASEIVTTEALGKPMHLVREIRVTHLPPDEA